MFKHLKLTSLNILIGAIIILLGLILATGLMTMRHQVNKIDQSWHTYMNDRSDKARLESSLRAAIGYGGMIHNVKNYILRADQTIIPEIHQQIIVAQTIIDQYRTLPISKGEQLALNDISTVLQTYDYNLGQSQAMHQSGLTPQLIDQKEQIDDSPALRGLEILGKGMHKSASHVNEISKGRHIANLRAAIGYGGMIHHFKNYILRQDEDNLSQIQHSFHAAYAALKAYENKTLSGAELIALNDIKRVLQQYQDNVHKITEYIEQGECPTTIDQDVKVDDSPALRGLKVLDGEVARANAQKTASISQSIEQISEISQFLTIGLISTILCFVLFLMWIYSRQIIQPIVILEKNMHDLADDKLDTVISGTDLDNELGSMNRALRIFQKNAQARKKSEEQLAHAHDNMEQQLGDIQQLKDKADHQTRNAMNLATNMDKARITAENAIIQAEHNEQRVTSILNTVTDGILTIDSGGIIESFNPGAEIMFGYRQGEVLGQQVFVILNQTDDNPAHGSLTDLLLGNHPLHEITTEHIGLRKNNSSFPIQLTINKMTVENEVKFTCVIHDLTLLKKAEDEILRLALTDSLTGLANRNQFNAKFKEIMSTSKRFNNNMALLMLDIDKFKPVNDTYGHPIGDELLIQIGQQLKTTGRDIDIIARLGGDEFAIILNGIKDVKAVETVAKRIISAIDTPFIIQSHTIQIGVSIGISLYPADADNQTDLIRYADFALYQAKTSDPKYQFYKPGLNKSP